MSWLINLAIGYVICVLVPVPYINAAIIRGWAALWGKIKPTTTPTS